MPKTILLPSGEMEMLEISKDEMDLIFASEVAESYGVPRYSDGERIWPIPEQKWVIVDRAAQ